MCTNPQKLQTDCLLLLLQLKLPKLNRTYTWDINVPINVGVEMSFPRGGLTQVNSDVCLDSVTYTIKGFVRLRDVHIGNFCRNGTISKVKIQGKTLLTNPHKWSLCSLSIAELCIVEAVLLKPGSPVYFMTPNWPQGFPDDELMSWKFTFPDDFKANVTLENYTYPQCVKRTVDVYFGPPVMGKMKKLWKNAVVSVQNCEVDKTKNEVLTLRFKAELLSNRYEFDMENVSVTFKQKSDIGSEQPCICSSPDSSKCNSELQLKPGEQANITFHTNCNSVKDIKVEATKNISCTELEMCQVKNMSLSLPSALANLPVDQQIFKWVLNAPHGTTIELVSNRLKLKQSLPGRTCTTNVMYHISTFCKDHSNSIVGTFCPSGAIEKIQMIDSVELEVRTSSGWKIGDLDISLSFVPAITENYIFYVVSDDSPVYLLTPNGELGMPHQGTASWNIVVPADHKAELTFVSSSMPECEIGHTSVTIIEQMEHTDTSTWRETDTLPTNPVNLLGTFWVNVSNCVPERGRHSFLLIFNTLADITQIIIIVAAVIGGLALLTIIFVVVCCVKRRKRRQHQTPVGIYNPGVNANVPGRRWKFGKGRKDNDSHIYAVIDENQIYGPRFNTLRMDSIPEVDVYQPFTGPMGDIAPTPPARRSRPGPEDSFSFPLTCTHRNIETGVGYSAPRACSTILYDHG
uniref:CUB domain-containing protein 1 n=1 Tax=Callorhinchus milii TaxID=7868 RepID=A0A4W3ITY4_CALMI